MDSALEAMTIGQLARAAGVGVETIRYYERRGLIPEPPRRPSGYRQYPPSARSRLEFIRRAKDLGFSLEEIGELLDLKSDPVGSCSDVQERIAHKLVVIENRLADLKRMRQALRDLERACSNREPSGDCPVLDTLARKEARR